MYVSALDEMAHRHFSIWLGSFYKNLLLVTLCFLALGLAMAPQTLLANIENYEKRVSGFIENRTALGYTGRVTLAETIESLDPMHPLHNLEKREYTWISYNFGSNIHNWCDRRPFLNVTTLPSLLRVMEFRASTQLFIRSSVLACLLFRFFLSIVAGNNFHHLSGRKLLVRVASLCLPVLDLAWMSFAVIVLCLQMDQDKLIKNWMYWHLPGFGVCFLLYSALYTMLYAWTVKKPAVTIVQFCSVLLFGSCMPQVVLGYLPFLEERGKPCYVDVPIEDALVEYGAMAAVLTFILTQFWELTTVEGIITIMEMEYQSLFVSTANYAPYYTSDSTRRSSVNSAESSSSESGSASEPEAGKSLSNVS